VQSLSQTAIGVDELEQRFKPAAQLKKAAGECEHRCLREGKVLNELTVCALRVVPNDDAGVSDLFGDQSGDRLVTLRTGAPPTVTRAT
jgi:hypothetical protein